MDTLREDGLDDERYVRASLRCRTTYGKGLGFRV